MITLKCTCIVTDNGKFIVSEQCRNCKECTTIAGLHPFGNNKL